MKVKELIEKLQALDPEMVVVGNFESGYEHIRALEEDVFVSRESDIRAVVISEDYDANYLTEADVDEKYVIEKNPESAKQCIDIPPALQELFTTILDDQMQRGQIFLMSSKPNTGFVEFPVHVKRKDKNENS